MNALRLPSLLVILAVLFMFSAAPVTASLPQGPWLDLLEIRADQAMETGDYAEVIRVADLYRRADGEPGVKLRAQEIVARARHTGNPGSAFVPLGQLIVEAGPEHEFYHSALRLYDELEQEQRRLASARAEPADHRVPQGARRAPYIYEVQAAVERRWKAPQGSSASDAAIVLVQINPHTGRILSYDMQRCTGGESFCNSVRQTMDRMQSLPRPPDAEAVRGGIRIFFSPPR